MRAVLLLLLVAVPLAAAQSEPAPTKASPGVEIAIDPARAELAAGDNLTATITLANTLDRPVTLRIAAIPNGSVSARVSQTETTLEPRERAIIRAQLHAPLDAAAGVASAEFVAREISPTAARDAAAAQSSARISLRITPQLTPMPEPMPPAANDAQQQPAADASRPTLAPEHARLAWGIALASTTVGAIAMGFAWMHRRWGILLAPLYTRIARSKVLDQPTRERIAKLVEAQPGITFSELQRALAMGAGTLTHHARMLERAGVLHSARDGQHRRFFLVSHGRQEDAPSLPDRALHVLATQGPATLANLARTLGVTRQALHYHVKRLEREGLVAVASEGGERVLRATAHVS